MTIDAEQLELLSAQNRIIACKFAGQLMLLDAMCALYVCESDTLVVSDLHFGKAQSLNRYGNTLPEYDSDATLAVLEQLLFRYQPASVVSLGDSFHDRRVSESLPPEIADKLCTLCHSVKDWVWVLGNHDEEISQKWPGRYVEEIRLQGIAFRHDYLHYQVPQVIGHFHPKYQARLSGTKVSGSCFMNSDKLMIMPALGSFTGGLAHDNDVLSTLFGGSTSVQHLCYQDKIYKMNDAD